MGAPLIGARVERKEDYRFLTGAGQYTDDVTLPHQTHAAFVRSPHGHAKITSVNTATRLALRVRVAKLAITVPWKGSMKQTRKM